MSRAAKSRQKPARLVDYKPLPKGSKWSLEMALARAIYDTEKCPDDPDYKCSWEYDCDCQERAIASAKAALRGLEHLGYKVWIQT